jgi:signal peptidase I
MVEETQNVGSRRLRWAAGVILSASIALLVCHEMVLSVYLVSGVSMEPTLQSGQRVLVLKAFGDLSRGDLIVFMNPTHPEEVLLKRVLATPGQQIEAVRGRIRVDTSELGEPYVKPGTTVGNLAASTLGEGKFYVLGDNRGESVDSRRFGGIDRRLIVGKVVYTLW